MFKSKRPNYQTRIKNQNYDWNLIELNKNFSQIDITRERKKKQYISSIKNQVFISLETGFKHFPRH